MKCKVMIKLVEFELEGRMGDRIGMWVKGLKKGVSGYVSV